MPAKGMILMLIQQSKKAIAILAILLIAGSLFPLGYCQQSNADNTSGWYTQYRFRNLKVGDIDAVDKDTVWATGRYWTRDSMLSNRVPRISEAAILRTTDGGNTWSLWTFEEAECAGGLSAVDENTAWAILDDYTVISTNDGGERWKQHDELPNADLFQVCAVDTNIVWIAASNDYIYLSNDGGKSWNKLSDPMAYANPGFTEFTYTFGEVAACDAQKAVIGGMRYAVGDLKREGFVIKTHTGGDHWFHSSYYDLLHGLSVDNEENVWVITRDAGKRSEVWRNSKPIWDTTHYLTDVFALDRDNVWVTGHDGAIWKFTNGGLSLHSEDSGTDLKIYWLSAVDAETAWATAKEDQYSSLILHKRRNEGLPIATSTWYLAEGCTDGGFETWVLVQNPGDAPVSVDMRFQTDGGEVQGPQVQIPARSRCSYDIGNYVTTYNVSTKVTASGGDIICERAMYGGNRTWGHNSIGTTEPAQTWYLAEGCTDGGFETWVLVQNPNDAPVSVDMRFQTDGGEVQGPHLNLAPNTRKSVEVSKYCPSNYNVATQVISDVPVVAERAMYFSGRQGAHNSLGVSKPAQTWYLAEGCTDGGFETWVLVQNPNDAPVYVDILFMTDSGQILIPRELIPANSRRSFNAGNHVLSFNVSTKVTATGGDIICERALYWDERNSGHASVGYTPIDYK